MNTKRRKPRAHQPHTYYTMMDELLASDSQPMPERNRTHQQRRMADALHELMHAPAPSNDAWRVVSDAVNLLETLVQHGEAPVRDVTTGNVIASHWRDCDGDPMEIADTSGLLLDAIAAMAKAGQRMFDRNLRGKPRGSARGSSEQAGTACGATSVASGQLACEVQQGQPHQPLPTAMLSGE